MANYYLSGNYNNTIDVILSLTESTNTTANTSTFNYTLYIYKKNNTSYSYSRGNHYGVTIGSYTTGDNTGGYSLGGVPLGGTYTLLTGTTSAIAHNSDGSGTVTISAWVRQDQLSNYNFSLSQTINLTTIPRASKPTASNATIGNTITINTNRASSSFTHTIQYKIGSLGYTNIATGVGASVNWTLPASLANYISNATSGTVTINCITYSGSTQIGTATTTLTATIPGTSLGLTTTGTITMGQNNNVTVINYCSSYLSVAITWSFGNGSGTLSTSWGTTTHNWPQSTYASKIPTSTSGKVTITQTTKRGSAVVSSSSASFTLNLGSTSTSASLSISDANGYLSRFGSYLSGKSKLSWSVSASPSIGSSISSYTVSVGSIGTYYTASGSVDVPASLSSGSRTVSVTTKDGRGSTATASQNYTVTKYSAPTVTNTTVSRTDSSGNPQPSSGTYIRIKGTVSWTAVGSNAVSAKYRIRQQNGSWSGYTNLTLSSNNFDTTVGTYSYEVGWEVQIVAADSVVTAGTTASYTVGSAVFPIDVYPSQTSGIAFGKVSTDQGVVDSAWPYKTSSQMAISDGKVAALTTGTSRVYGDGFVISNPATSNDQGWIRVTGTGESDTVLEIATGDDANGSEQIVARQYNTSNAVARELKLFDESGNTSVPGKLYTKTAFGYIGANSTYDVIKFKEGDQWGQGVVIGAGGLTVIGGGESASAIADTYSSGGDEVLALTSDQAVYVKTGVQNGAANAKTSTFYADGTLEIPNALHTGDVKYYGHVVGGSDGTANMWVCLGTLTSSGDSSNVIITLYTGDGYNGNERQNTTIRIRIKDGYQSTHSTSSAFGASVTFEDSPNMAGNNIWATAVRVRATAYNVCQVWVKLPWGYYNGEYTVEGRFHDWVHSGARQSSDPTSGVSQNVSYYGSWGISTNTSGYIRFAQGAHKMQIAWKQVTVTTKWTSAWNSLWESSLIDCGGWAANFNARPASAASAFGNGNTRGAMFESNTGATATHAGKYYLVNTGQIATDTSMVVTVIAVGSW